MIKCQRWKIFCLVFQICLLSVKTYYFKCPSQAAWKLRAHGKCNSLLKYFCLYNNVKEEYVEGCNGPDWDRKGSKRIYAGHFSRDKCSNHRFQPFIFWTERSMSDCIYAKSICSLEGQIVYNDNSTKNDRSCRCDYDKFYSFVKTPRNVCFCIPTEEDCSCYIKSCPVNMKLSADYSCTKTGTEETPKCKDIAEYTKILNDKIGVFMVANHSWSNKITTKHRRKDSATILICFVGIVIMGGCIVGIVFHKWINGKLQRLKKCIQRKQKDDGDEGTVKSNTEAFKDIIGGNSHATERKPVDQKTNDLNVKRISIPKEFPSHQKKRKLLTYITSEEKNFVLVVLALKKIIYPVIKNHFETQCPDDVLHQIRMNIFEDQTAQHNSYSTKDDGRTINRLFLTEIKNGLFSPDSMTKGEWKNVDLKLMIYNLKRIAKNEENRYCVDQLDIIDNIRREIVQSKSGVLDETSFNDIIENIRQAVLYLGGGYHEQKLLNILRNPNIFEQYQKVNVHGNDT